ncbi:MAG: hypothetical protein RL458_3435, partial [Pseudomonadota bacterium]
MSVTVADLFAANAEELGLAWVAGRPGEAREVAHTAAEPADLIGHLNLIHPNRIHVFGQPELDFFLRHDPARQQGILTDLVAGHPPAVIVADSLQPPA